MQPALALKGTNALWHVNTVNNRTSILDILNNYGICRKLVYFSSYFGSYKVLIGVPRYKLKKGKGDLNTVNINVSFN